MMLFVVNCNLNCGDNEDGCVWSVIKYYKSKQHIESISWNTYSGESNRLIIEKM